MRHVRRSNGFTLLELIVSIGIMSIVTTMGFTMFSQVNDLWRDALTRTNLDNKAENLIFELMRADFAEVLSAKLSGTALRGISQEAQVLGHSEANDRIVFPIQGIVGREGRLQAINVMYRIERKDPKQPWNGTLVRTVSKDMHKESPEGSPMALAGGVPRMRIEYLTAAGKWIGSWSEATLPRAVRVSLALVDEDYPDQQVSRKAVFPINVE